MPATPTAASSHENQPAVVADLARQIAGGERRIMGVMVESHLVAGRQDLVARPRPRLRPVDHSGHVAQGDRDDERGDRQVDDEDQPPRDRLDQPAAEKRADGRAHAAEAGPGADRLAAVLRAEGRLDDRQAARSEQRRADALQRPGPDQRDVVGRDRAQQRSGREPDDADQEDLLAAELVAERSGEQQQSRQRQRVRRDDPLQGGQAGAELLADGGQRDAHHRGVDRRHRRAEDRGQQHPPPRPA